MVSFFFFPTCLFLFTFKKCCPTKVHVLLDLQGHTLGSRPEILTPKRAAPVQVSVVAVVVVACMFTRKKMTSTEEKESLHRHLVKQNTSSLSSFVSRDSLFLFLNKSHFFFFFFFFFRRHSFCSFFLPSFRPTTSFSRALLARIGWTI